MIAIWVLLYVLAMGVVYAVTQAVSAYCRYEYSSEEAGIIIALCLFWPAVIFITLVIVPFWLIYRASIIPRKIGTYVGTRLRATRQRD